MPVTEFTPFTAAVGGAILALALLLYLLFTGGSSGITCMWGSAISNGKHRTRHVTFLVGMFVGGYIIALLYPPSTDIVMPLPGWVIAISGAVTGYGAAEAGGCTSGHGLIGTGRFMLRSVVATLIFFTVAIITATLLHGVWGVTAS